MNVDEFWPGCLQVFNHQQDFSSCKVSRHPAFQAFPWNYCSLSCTENIWKWFSGATDATLVSNQHQHQHQHLGSRLYAHQEEPTTLPETPTSRLPSQFRKKSTPWTSPKPNPRVSPKKIQPYISEPSKITIPISPSSMPGPALEEPGPLIDRQATLCLLPTTPQQHRQRGQRQQGDEGAFSLRHRWDDGMGCGERNEGSCAMMSSDMLRLDGSLEL